jgi:hypothetical protein
MSQETLNIFRDDEGRPLKKSGCNEREVHPTDFGSIVKDIFDVAIYGKLHSDQPYQAKYQEIESNESFWSKVMEGELREGMRVLLRDFHVMEWIPISPGRFFTPEASAARRRALQYVYGEHEEFLPLGKSEMVFGGIGSVRLKSRVIDRDRFFFAGATASGVSHEGNPLLIRDKDFCLLVNSLADHGGVRCNISGWIRVLPDELSLIGMSVNENRGIESGLSSCLPKYCLEVEKILKHKTSKRGELLATAAIMFPTDYYRGSGDSRGGLTFSMNGYETYFKKSWSFCSFDPSEGISAINRAAQWLQDYAGRYSGKLGATEKDGRPVPIFSDFDEHCDHFLPRQQNLWVDSSGSGRRPNV